MGLFKRPLLIPFSDPMVKKHFPKRTLRELKRTFRNVNPQFVELMYDTMFLGAVGLVAAHSVWGQEISNKMFEAYQRFLKDCETIAAEYETKKAPQPVNKTKPDTQRWFGDADVNNPN